eukprot:367888-Rhodomonas_salina.5
MSGSTIRNVSTGILAWDVAGYGPRAQGLTCPSVALTVWIIGSMPGSAIHSLSTGHSVARA